MKFLFRYLESFKKRFKKKMVFVERLDIETLRIIKNLVETGIPVEDISTVLDLSKSRVNYEIKQLENKNI